MPPGTDATVNPPSDPVTTLYFSPVPLFLTSTLAPGMTAPDVSATVPDSDVKKLPCAKARGVKERTSDAASSTQANRTLIETLPLETHTYKRIREVKVCK